MPKTSSIGSIRTLFKGRPKTRKTVAYASWPGKHYIFMFDPDGARPIEKHFPERVESGEIQYDYYHSGNLVKSDEKMRQILENNPYDNISIDSLTFGGHWSMDYGLDQAKNLDKVGYVRMPGQREYGVEHNIMMALIGAGFKLSLDTRHKCNFFLTAHVMENQIFSADGKLVSTKQRLVSGGKSLAEKVLAAFKEVWHFEIGSESTIQVGAASTFKVITQSRGDSVASTDLPLPKEMDITSRFLYDIVKEELAKKGLSL